MIDILPPAGWPNVRQLETNEFATGGANGNMNEQAKSLAARSELLKKYAALPYESKTGGYALNERVQLATGDIVRSTIASNANNPNVDMTGWVKTNSTSQIFNESGLSQQEINNEIRPKVNFYVTPENFGAKGDGITDDYESLQTCFLSGLNVHLSEKTYATSKTLYHRSNVSITGCGATNSIILKTTTDTSGLPVLPAPAEAGNVIYDRDAILIALPEPGDYCKGVHLTGFSLKKADSLNFTGYGYFAPYIGQCTFRDFYASVTEYGIYTVNCWMTEWVRCQGQGKAGWVIGGLTGDLTRGGTSSTFISCWSLSTRAGYYAWNVYNMHSSTFIGASADFIGNKDSIALGVWNVVNCEEVSMINCGSELVHAEKLARVRDSNLTIDGWYNEQFFNRYGGASTYLIDIDGASRVHIKKGNFLFNDAAGAYANSPKWIKVGTSSTLIYDQDNLTYPRITGVDDLSSFSIDILNASYGDIKTNGLHYIRNKGSNLAIPSATTRLVNTDLGYRTTGEITSLATAGATYFGLTAASAGRWNTAHYRIGDQHLIYSNAMNALLFKASSPTSDTDGVPTYLPVGIKSGTTAQRPVAPFIFAGRYYWDTTLGKPIWYNGTNWTDANGLTV